MNALPRYFSRREPFIIGVESCIAFVPAKDFNGEVSLFVVGALSYEKDKVCPQYEFSLLDIRHRTIRL